MALKDTLPSNDPSYVFYSKVIDTVKQNTPIISADFLKTTNSGGTSLSLHSKHKNNPNYPSYTGEYNITGSYTEGDIVRVMPDKTYSLPWDSPPEISNIENNGALLGVPNNTPVVLGTMTISNTSIKQILPNYIPVPGVYICVHNVPSFTFVLAWLLQLYNSFIDAIGVLAQFKLADHRPFVQKNVNYIRFANVNYFPVWPELPNKAVFDPNDLTKLNGRYWELISLLPEKTKFCLNGVTSTGYVDQQLFPTGSANYAGT